MESSRIIKILRSGLPWLLLVLAGSSALKWLIVVLLISGLIIPLVMIAMLMRFIPPILITVSTLTLIQWHAYRCHFYAIVCCIAWGKFSWASVELFFPSVSLNMRRKLKRRCLYIYLRCWSTLFFHLKVLLWSILNYRYLRYDALAFAFFNNVCNINLRLLIALSSRFKALDSWSMHMLSRIWFLRFRLMIRNTSNSFCIRGLNWSFPFRNLHWLMNSFRILGLNFCFTFRF